MDWWSLGLAYGLFCRIRRNGQHWRTIFFFSFWGMVIKTMSLKQGKIWSYIYQACWRVFHHQMNDWEESWKYDAHRSIFDKLRGVSSGEETLRRMLDITSQTKWVYTEKLKMQKWAVFHLISKHSLNINFLCIFFMNCYEFEKQVKNWTMTNTLPIYWAE